MEILWTFSIYLESLAILPQLFMVTKTGEAESITSHYLFALGMYRALYILNWIYRYYFEGMIETRDLNFLLKNSCTICRFLRHHCDRGRLRADVPLLWLFLPLCYKGAQGQETAASGMNRSAFGMNLFIRIVRLQCHFTLNKGGCWNLTKYDLDQFDLRSVWSEIKISQDLLSDLDQKN